MLQFCASCPCLAHGQNRPRHKQDGPWAWVVLLCTFIQNCLLGGFVRSYGIFLPVLMKDFNEGRDKVALIGSVASGTMFLLTVISSWLCNHFGGQLLNGTGHIILIVSLVLSSLIYNNNAMFFTYGILIAFGFSFILTSNILFTVKYFKKHRSLALGINSAGTGVGVMTVPIILQYLLDALGWRNLFRAVSGCVALFGFISLVLDPNVEDECDGGEPTDEQDQRRTKKVLSIRDLLDFSIWKRPNYTISVISISIASFAVLNPFIHLIKFAEETGISAAKASTLYTFLGLTTIISRIVSGRLSDFPRIDPRLINMLAEVVGGVSAFFLPFAQSYAHLVAFACVYGLVDGAFRLTTNLLFATTVPPSKASSGFGQGYSVTAIFLMAGPSISGLMADTSGNYKSAFFMSGIVLLASAAVHIIPACSALRNRSGERSLEPITIGMDAVPSPCTGTGYRARSSSQLNQHDFKQVNHAFDV